MRDKLLRGDDVLLPSRETKVLRDDDDVVLLSRDRGADPGLLPSRDGKLLRDDDEAVPVRDVPRDDVLLRTELPRDEGGRIPLGEVVLVRGDDVSGVGDAIPNTRS